jgi:hypothetical protein
VGELLALGANRGLKNDVQRIPLEIACEKHPERPDLQYILFPGKRTLTQLLRKVAADSPNLFTDYDGNQVVFDLLIEFFTSEFCSCTDEDFATRFTAAFRAVTGVPLSEPREITFRPSDGFEFVAETTFWRDRLLPVLVALHSKAHIIPIEAEWAVISDLFNPAPEQWGLRGDLFLWIEMRQALCHVEIPRSSEEIAKAISAAFMALTGFPLERSSQVWVKRLSRGAMSSGMVSGEFWSERFIPLLQKRARWLREAWQR